MLNKVPHEAVKPTRPTSRWFHQVNAKLAKLFTLVNDLTVLVHNHEVEFKAMEGRVLFMDQELVGIKELNGTLTKKIIKLDERISTLESSLDRHKLVYDTLIMSSNAKMCDLIEENKRLREELEQLQGKE